MAQRTHYLVVDLEATCSEDGTVPRSEMEIIEIGAVLVHAKTLAIEDEFQTFVRPVRHPQLTPFCTELTGITQATVDASPGFPQAMESFRRWALPGRRAQFCSWGDFDRAQLQRDCKTHRVKYPFRMRHLNLKPMFSRSLRTRRRFGLKRALDRAGLELLGTHHSGIDDARNTARLLPFCLGRVPFPPPRTGPPASQQIPGEE